MLLNTLSSNRVKRGCGVCCTSWAWGVVARRSATRATQFALRDEVHRPSRRRRVARSLTHPTPGQNIASARCRTQRARLRQAAVSVSGGGLLKGTTWHRAEQPSNINRGLPPPNSSRAEGAPVHPVPSRGWAPCLATRVGRARPRSARPTPWRPGVAQGADASAAAAVEACVGAAAAGGRAGARGRDSRARGHAGVPCGKRGVLQGVPRVRRPAPPGPLTRRPLQPRPRHRRRRPSRALRRHRRASRGLTGLASTTRVYLASPHTSASARFCRAALCVNAAPDGLRCPRGHWSGPQAACVHRPCGATLQCCSILSLLTV
jgi:hypothetical protein